MTIIPLLFEATNAALIGVISSVLGWMWCHRGIYSWRDFGIVLLLLLSMVLRLLNDTPPPGHFVGIMIMNLIFILVAAMVWARPSRIPAVEKVNQCLIVRTIMDAWWLIRGKKTEYNIT